VVANLPLFHILKAADFLGNGLPGRMEWCFRSVVRASSTNLSTAGRDNSGCCGQLRPQRILHTSLFLDFDAQNLFFSAF
jgi:hypothetical protein